MTPPGSKQRSARPAPRDDVALMEGYHSPQVDVDVRLNTNESPMPPPAGFVDELTAAIGSLDWNRYPDREATALRAAIGKLHGVRPEQVFVANGSNEVLQVLLLTYGGPGRTAAVFEPTYALHRHIARLTGTNVVTGARDESFGLDPDEVRRVVAEAAPDLLFLCSPNNPTGRAEEAPVVRHALDSAPGLVVVDEAYAQFAPWSALDLVGDEVALAVTRTYSKTWSMAAARLGYLIGPAWLVDELWKVALPYHVDAIKQIAGRIALDHVAEMEARVAVIIEERGRIEAGLADLDVDVWPSAANFVLFRPRRVAGDDVWQRLLDQSVLIRNGASWPGLEGCLRVTVGTTAENERFLEALRRALGERPNP